MNRQAARARAPGKLILAGEHAVVYGHPALAIAVDRGTTVTLRRSRGPTRLGRCAVRDPRLLPGLLTVLPEDGLEVDIDSDLPVGRGMGSSAALAVAVVRAHAALQDEVLDFATTHARAFGPERHFHGDPSGVDHAVSALGGGVRYMRTPTGPRIAPVSLPQLELVVVDSGSAGNTAQLVAGVRARRRQVAPILDRIGLLVEELTGSLGRGASRTEIGGLLTENHRLLCDIGVSTPTLDAIVDACLAAGAHGAKLAGAGGGGVVLALVSDAAPVLAAVAAAGWPAFRVGVAPVEG
ncbi:MAG: mevalonate kinase [Myxococcota bacterium]|nr:mevalonate kinase [Myxococcota bacterium]MEC8424116.1 mevalonate kinase [Myxococcota bacterium]